ncbi:MAG TPA: 23S rRNA (guanosine(2251)-2'-O)-methyltransferase RlmB [Clostridia bacterium]|nr:23S rRNA (guanosine(2251)-2'-O)-methyltransferase RlmB [Clostridia bacterium]
MAGLISGKNPVLEALKANRPIEKILIARGLKSYSVDLIYKLARQKGIIVQEVDRKKIDKLSETTAHQGIIAYAAPKEYVDVDYLLQRAEELKEDPFIVILAGIEDPYNLGAILRTADAAGVHGVVIPKRRAVGLTETVAKASAGAIEYVPVARVSNLAQTVDYLKTKGIWIAGSDASAAKSYWEENLAGPLALIVGSEGAGMGRLLTEKCDYLLKLPMKGEISSLNASVAASLLMYEVMRQREFLGY